MKRVVLVLALLFTINLHSQESGWENKGEYLEQKLKIGNVTFLKFSEDGEYFYTFSSDNIFRKWNSESGNQLLSLDIKYDNLKDFDFDPVTEKVGIVTYSNGAPTTVKSYIIDINNPDSILTLKPAIELEGVQYVGVVNCFIIIDGKNNRVITSLKTNYNAPYSSNNSGIVYFWDINDGHKIDSMDRKVHWNDICKISASGSLITGYWSSNSWTSPSHGGGSSSYNEVYLTNITTGETRTLMEPTTSTKFEIKKICISKDENYVGYLTNDSIYIWNTNNDKSYKFKPHVGFLDCEFSTFDDWMFAVTKKQLIKLQVPPADIHYKNLPDSITAERIFPHPASASVLITRQGKMLQIKTDSMQYYIKANFESLTSKALVNDTVRFKNTSYGKPSHFLWSFGDGSTSTEENPYHIYTNAGNYTVTLIISFDNLTDTLIKENYIFVRNEIIPDFAASVISGNVPLEVQFEDKSIGNILNWNWDFGDGAKSNEQNPTHIYEKDGNYNVKLTVSDSIFSYSKVIEKYIKVSRIPILGVVTNFENDLGIDDKYRWSGNSGIECSDGSYAICGQGIYSTQINYYVLTYVIKLDKNGDTLWTRIIEKSRSIQETNNKEFLLVGKGQKNASDFLVLRLDSNGNQISQNIYGTINDDNYQQILATPDGGFIIVGNSYFNYPKKSIIFKCDAAGNQEFIESFDGIGVTKIINTKDGGFAFVTDNGGSYFLFKTNNKGKKEWMKEFKSQYTLDAYDLMEYNEGFIIVGQKIKNEQGVINPGYFVYVDKNGFTNTEYESIQSNIKYLCVAPRNENFVISGDFNGNMGLDIFDSNCQLKESIEFKDRKGVINSIVRTKDNGLFLVGTINPPFTTSRIFALKINGEIDTSKIDTIVIAEKGIISSPNPSSGTGTISFTLEKAGNIVIKLYSTTGILQKTICDIYLNEGIQSIPFKLVNYADGMYYYTIEQEGKFLSSGKIVLIK